MISSMLYITSLSSALTKFTQYSIYTYEFYQKAWEEKSSKKNLGTYNVLVSTTLNRNQGIGYK